MYESFYKLRAEPFRLSPDHRFCYEHKGYAKARAYMAYAFMRAEGFVMITGRPGTGKTTLIGDLIESLAGDNVTTANLVCTQLQADDLLKTVAYSFGVGSGGVDKAELLQRLNVLFHNWHRDDRRALLIVDEAQDLSITAMEELRLLTNIQLDGQPLLQIFLLGQPELRDLILSPEMEQVHQRIVASSHLAALELEETEAYVRHRLEAVGWRGDPALSKAIFPLIYKFSEGVPRRINLICSRLFLHGGVEQQHNIGVQDVRVVISELQAENLAAGTGFAETDFAIEDEFEQLASVEGPPAVQASAEVRLHAVHNEPSVARESTEQIARPKKKDIPVVTAIPQAVPADLPPERKLPVSSQGSREDYEAPAGPKARSSGELAVEQADTGRERGSLNQPVGQLARQRPRGRSAGLWIVLIILLGFLIIFVALQGGWGDRQGDSVSVPSNVTTFGSAPTAIDSASHPSSGVVPEIEPELEPGSGGESVPDLGSGPESVLPAASTEMLNEIPIIGSGLPVRQRSFEETADGAPGLVPAEDSVLPDGADDMQTAGASELNARSSEPVVRSQLTEVLAVAFAFDSVGLSPEARRILDRVVEAMRDSPGSMAFITGFSDNQGEEAYNLLLSRERANTVAQYIVSSGVQQNRLRLEGRGARYDSAGHEVPVTEPGPEGQRIVLIRIGAADPG